MKDYQFIHDTEEFIKENYPKITKEQILTLVESGAVRRFRKLKKERTYYVNEKNGSILYYNYYKSKFEMCYYFIDPEHPLEKLRQQKIAEKENKSPK